MRSFLVKNGNILNCLFCNIPKDYFWGILKHATVRIIDVDYYIKKNKVMRCI